MTRVCVHFRMDNCSGLLGAGMNEVLTVPLDLMEQDSEMMRLQLLGDPNLMAQLEHVRFRHTT